MPIGIPRPDSAEFRWCGPILLYVENGDSGGTLDLSTFLSSLFAFFAAFFAFFAVFCASFVFLDILSGPPVATVASWTLRHMSQVFQSSLRNGGSSLSRSPDRAPVSTFAQTEVAIFAIVK